MPWSDLKEPVGTVGPVGRELPQQEGEERREVPVGERRGGRCIEG